MKQRPTSPRIRHLRQEVAQEKRRTKIAPPDSRSSRYLAAVAGMALLVAILGMEAPVGVLSAPSAISEASQP
jgi:hypothetical protein